MRPFLLLAAAFLSACSPPFANAPPEPAPAGCVLDVPPTIGGPIDLIEHTGAAVTQARFAGAPALVYFGFTYCPDVCPFSLQVVKESLAALGPAGERVRPVLISLDPARDTPLQLASYVASEAFPKGLIGLTGSEAQAAAAAKAFRVAWRRNDDPGSAAQYLIDHSSFFYLMGPDWRTLALFPGNMPPADAAACLRAALAKAAP